jgi:hypothetical protein
MNNYELSKKVKEAYCFLNNHPAINRDLGDFLNINFNWWLDDYCKHNIVKETCENIETMTVDVFSNEDNYQKFYNKYADENNDKDHPCDYLNVPYVEIYGELWSYYRTLYCGNYSWFTYSPNKKYPKISNLQYEAYEGSFIRAETWEELIIKVADDVKEKFGDFKSEDFYTEKEKENHIKEEYFNRIPIEHNNQIKMFTLKRNKKYIEVSQGQLNLRWFDWFKTTKYFKDNWESSLSTSQ